MGVLDLLKPELEYLSNTLASVLGLEITIVDSELNRLIGTGRMAEGIGKKAPDGSAFYQCLESGEHLFVENPRQSYACRKCEHIGDCEELVEFCIPIHYNKAIVGVLGMCAFEKDAREEIIRNKNNMLAFETQLSRLITMMLREREFESIVEYHSSELISLLNSLDQGAMILNDKMEILALNSHMRRILNLGESQAPESISDILHQIPDKLPEELKNVKTNKQIGPVSISGHEYLISANTIDVKSGMAGLVLLFSDLKKVRQTILNVEKDKTIVTFDDILGESEMIRKARYEAQQVAGFDVPVLLTGETGTGKEVFSQAIHSHSSRQDDILLPINCGAIPENLMESEFFGYDKGAFTGAAKTGRPGKFEVCKNGTLFLDEIGDLPLHMQVKLLRALENKEIMRIGASEPIPVNPRIIAATSRDLAGMIREKQFREDLFYRLNVVSIKIPPLRERGYDIIILARHFLEKYSKVYNKTIYSLAPESEQLLMEYSFPGNIRELRNLIEHAVIFEQSSRITVDSLMDELNNRRSTSEETPSSFSLPEAPAHQRSGLSETARPLPVPDKAQAQTSGNTLLKLKQDYEKQLILSMLEERGGGSQAKKEVARELGISLATLYRRLN